MNKLFPFIGFLIFILFCGCKTSASQNTKSIGNIPAIDSLISSEIKAGHIPGAVIRVQQGDSILHREAYGYAQKYRYGMKPLKEPIPMTVEHLFDLASLTKVCATIFGVMLLVDAGKLQLDDPIYKWLPEFKTGPKKKITVRHLLTHSSGLRQWYPLYYKASNKKERYKVIAGMPLKWQVGEARHYSDLGFMLLGDIIERITGQPLDVFLQQNLYQLLNLNHTTFNPLEKGFQKIAATSHGNPFEKQMVYDDHFGYRVNVDPHSWNGWRQYTLKGEVSDGNAWYANGGVAGHAGLFSTVDDLQKLVNLLLNGGRYQGKQIISEAVIDTFLTKDKYGNALGWAMDLDFISAEGAPAGTFGHTGFTGTSIVAMPEYDLSIILLTNRENVGRQENGYYYNLGPLRQKIVDVVLSL
ncbi:MAG TPA: serine hydrolase [Balneolaceae bacterium]|nr:serine hydrolase [Balneolaceae bacterium]